MARLSTNARDALPGGEFGLPEKRKYPMPDDAHAHAAKGRAEQQVAKGNLSEADKRQVDRKADEVLGRNN